MFQDLAFAIRNFRSHPGFTCAALLTLALGIGANTAVYSVIDGVLLHPVPFPESDRLVALYQKGALADKNSVSYPNLLDWQRMSQTFEGIAGWRTDGFTLTLKGQPEQLLGLMVSSNFFSVLRVQPLLGRTFTPDEDRRGGHPVLLLGEDFWKRRFAADPKILGTSVTIQQTAYEVIGVVPSNVRLSRNFDSFMNDVFLPIGQRDFELFYDRGASDGTAGLGRLKAGVSLAEAKAEMDTIMSGLVKEYPNDNAGVGVNVIGYEEDLIAGLRSTLVALGAAVALVLIIACTNVASLMLAWSTRRSPEFGIRLALGAGRRRLIRQLLTESAALSLAGGFLGVLIAVWGTEAALAVLPSALPPMSHVEINARVLFFSFALSLLTAILFGVFPAIKAGRVTLHETLKQGGRGLVRTQHRAQRVVIVAEVALTLVLLVGSGLLIRSLQKVWSVDPGFDPENLVMFYTGISPARADTPDEIRAAMAEIGDRLAKVPGVESASTQVGGLPFIGNSTISFSREDEPQPDRLGEMRVANFYAVGPDHFETMRIPLVRGRSFTRQDAATSSLVTIIDEELARTAFPGEDPLGKHIVTSLFDPRPTEIVGIARHVTHSGLDTDATARIRSQFYFPIVQLPEVILPFAVRAVAGIVRSSVPPPALTASIRREMTAFDSSNAISKELIMTDAIRTSLAGRRFALMVLAAFSVIALVLSVAGIYGVVSYFVNQRTSEFGLRMALGAQSWNILYDVLGAGGKLVAIGLVVGIAGAAGLTRLMQSLLFNVSPVDFIAFALASLTLSAATLLACYIPARRAAHVDPLTALRDQ